MKALLISLTLATSLLALTGAGFVWCAAQAKPQSDAAPAGLEQVEKRFAEILERIQEVESELSSLRGRVLTQASSPAAAPAQDAEGPAPGVQVAESPQKAGHSAAREVESLRGVVYQLIQDEREERQLEAKQEAQTRMAQRLKETEELYQGPYGDYNYRMNLLSKRLNFTDQQKQQYYTLLSTYSSRIEEMRNGLDRNNPEVYDAYREKKKQVQEEFERLVVQNLTPEQAKTFQGLPFSHRSAAVEATTGAKEKEAMLATQQALEATPEALGGARQTLGGLKLTTDPVKFPGAAAGVK